ncbi:MAG: B12-binding domain-containing radical SAM protein, partial [Cytophagales bacterium]|nr:B12-binding domain-containing radical SAM protein [Cytophagales bacterium]
TAGADFVILGEGEMTLLELVTALESHSDPALIQGLAYKQGEEIINLGRRPVLRDLDLLPMPAWDLVEISKYQQLWKEKHGYFSLNIATSRGCTYKCNWCAKPIFGNRYHARSPENVLEEAKMLVSTFQASHIWFADDIFGLKPGWIAQFADLVEKENLRFKFKIQSRADLLLDEMVVKDLARAGCDEIWIGAESGSQKILDAMDKGITIDQIYQSRYLLKKYHIRAAFFLQFGYPGESKSDIAKTIDMVTDLMPEEIGISVSYPLPGTKFYENVKSQLKEKTNWTDSDEMAMMFSHEYPDHYYKDLQVFVHKAYRKQRSWQNLKQVFRSPFQSSWSQLRSALLFFYYFPLVTMKRGQFLA